MDYKGGTYISQVKAKFLNEAVRNWGKQINPNEIYGFGEKTKSMLLEQLELEETVPIKDLQNVWCVSFSLRNQLTLVNVVETKNNN